LPGRKRPAPAGFSSSEAAATKAIERPSLDEIRSARERLTGIALRTPLVRAQFGPSSAEIWLKLENLQPIGSFKIRGSGNALASAPPGALARGVYTASAGNMAQGVAWNARRLGVPCAVVVPETAPKTKLQAIERLGARYVKEPFDRWWRVLVEHRYDGLDGLFVHPVSDPAVVAGNGTIGLEILEDLPEVDTILVPYGGGGLSSGIAAAAKALSPRVRVFACEVETAAPFAASLAAGAPVKVDYRASFVDGIGAGGVLPEMWPLASGLLDGSLVAKLADVAGAVRLLAERQRVVAEGAGAVPVAAALSGEAGGGKIVCVVSGGNIDAAVLARILGGEVP
jgi:threonine dehydratase